MKRVYQSGAQKIIDKKKRTSDTVKSSTSLSSWLKPNNSYPEQTYHFVTGPPEVYSEESEMSDDASGSSTEDEAQNSANLQETSKVKDLWNPGPTNTQAFYQHFMLKNASIDPDLEFFSNQTIGRLTKVNRSLKKMSTVFKKPVEKNYVSTSNMLARISNKSQNLMIVRKAFNMKSEPKNNSVVIKKITIINKNTLDVLKEDMSKFLNVLQTAEPKGLNELISFDNLKLDFQARSQKEICPLLNSNEQFNQLSSNKKNAIMLNDDDMSRLQKTALYIISYLNIACKTQLSKHPEVCVFLHAPGVINSSRESAGVTRNSAKRTLITVQLQAKETTSNIIITELDPTENSESPRKRIKIGNTSEKILIPAKKSRKRKNQKQSKHQSKYEQEEAVFSSKQCFSRLAYFMSTNQGYTKSKLIMELEKELKPIKDQISELRDSMTDFSVVNCRYNKKGIKSSTLTVQPLQNSFKTKSIFTVPSMYAQRLACLQGTTHFRESYYPEIELGPKKLSPLAEMYVKLARH